MTSGKPYDELTFAESEEIEANYVCAQCWGHLLSKKSSKGSRLWITYCPNCGEDRGFVTKTSADQRKEQDHWDAFDAAKNLKSALGQDEKEKTDLDKIIQDLYP